MTTLPVEVNQMLQLDKVGVFSCKLHNFFSSTLRFKAQTSKRAFDEEFLALPEMESNYFQSKVNSELSIILDGTSSLFQL